MTPITSETSEFADSDSEKESGFGARVPRSPRLIPMPADKILFPRRMIYIEAVLYLLIAAASFGLGYLLGRGGNARPVASSSADKAEEKRVPVQGQVMLAPVTGAPRQADAGAIVIALPDDKSPAKPLAPSGLRPDDPPARPSDPGMTALASLGGTMTRTGDDGSFALVVPRPGLYHFLIISKRLPREPVDALQQQYLREIENYFVPPEDVLKDHSWKWVPRKVQAGMGSIDVDFTTSSS
jgi:hypothetical protein